MTMHLMHPQFTMSGKRKGKIKFKSAAEAQRARELAKEWELNQAKWKAMSKKVTPAIVVSSPAIKSSSSNRPTEKINSLNSWVTGPVSTKQTQQYTGTEVLGITIVHKSCLQPVFNQQEAVDAATMRR